MGIWRVTTSPLRHVTARCPESIRVPEIGQKFWGQRPFGKGILSGKPRWQLIVFPIWGFPGMGAPQVMVGLFQGKSHLEMDDDWGIPL